MVVNCECKLRVFGTYSKVASNGKTYFHLQGVPLEGGPCGDFGCTEDIAKTVKNGSAYIFSFDINPFYLKKDYSTSINFKSAELIK